MDPEQGQAVTSAGFGREGGTRRAWIVLAFGLAVVATPVGSVTDIVIEEETGLLVPPGDASTLGEAIRRLLADPAMCRR